MNLAVLMCGDRPPLRRRKRLGRASLLPGWSAASVVSKIPRAGSALEEDRALPQVSSLWICASIRSATTAVILDVVDRAQASLCDVAMVRIDAGFPSAGLQARGSDYVARLRANAALDRFAAPFWDLLWRRIARMHWAGP